MVEREAYPSIQPIGFKLLSPMVHFVKFHHCPNAATSSHLLSNAYMLAISTNGAASWGSNSDRRRRAYSPISMLRWILQALSNYAPHIPTSGFTGMFFTSSTAFNLSLCSRIYIVDFYHHLKELHSFLKITCMSANLEWQELFSGLVNTTKPVSNVNTISNGKKLRLIYCNRSCKFWPTI